jgi:peptidoglycan/LPS O-acetylase OafA/YrhL
MQVNTARERFIGLDILRSLAILLVIASHWANNMAFWYGIRTPQQIFFLGDLGVDLFFALSSFLIGRILLDIIVAGPSWGNLGRFMMRRWMRTLPAYWLCVALLSLFFPPALDAAGIILQCATLTQNLWHAMPPGYWFAVSWSLTIEEWFYLLFGTGAVVSAMFIRRDVAIWIPLIALLLVPPGLRWSIPSFSDFSTGYYKVVPFRIDEIGYGVVLAWLYEHRSRILSYPRLLMLAGMFLIAAGWFQLLPISFRLFLVLQHVMVVVGCVLCIPAALALQGVPRWLSLPARHISRLSYTLYLVHLTVLVDVAQPLWWTHRLSSWEAVAVSVLVPVIVAELMSRLVEQPLMRLRPRQFRHAAATPAFARAS